MESFEKSQNTPPAGMEGRILNSLGEPVFCCDALGTCLYVNQSFLDLLGVNSADVKSQQDLFCDNELNPVCNLVKYAVKFALLAGKPDEFEYKTKSGDETRYYTVKIIPVSSAQDAQDGDEKTMAIVRAVDVTEIKRIEQLYKEKQAMYDRAQKIANICSYIYNLETDTWECSAQFYELFGISDTYKRDKKGFINLFDPENHAYLVEEGVFWDPKGKRFDQEFKIVSEDAEKPRWVRALGEFTFDGESKPVQLVGTFEDISAQKKEQEDLIYFSYHDKLTGLYNRRFYEEELKRVDTERNLPISIIIGDVNGLKLTNETYGHEKGDQLLKEAASVIMNVCRADDIVARWGGDEFVILLPKTPRDEANKIIKRIRYQCTKKHVDSISVDIAFGLNTKENINEDVRDIFKNAEDSMYNNKVIEGTDFKNNNIYSIVNALHDKKPSEKEHSQRVGELCWKLGQHLGISEADADVLTLVGFLHDIGQIAVESEILNKQGTLTETEMERMKRHPEVGYRLIRSCFDKSQVADYVLAHHERWDGKGYPKGLKGEQIPRISRIIAVVDSYDAMTNNTLYKTPITSEAAVGEIIKNSGSQFDPHIARVFVEKVIGLSWKLPEKNADKATDKVADKAADNTELTVKFDEVKFKVDKKND